MGDKEIITKEEYSEAEEHFGAVGIYSSFLVWGEKREDYYLDCNFDNSYYEIDKC